MIMRNRKFKEFKVQGIKDYCAIYVWDKLQIGHKLELKILEENFIRTDNPHKRANESVAIIYNGCENCDCKSESKDVDKNAVCVIGFIPDDEMSGIYEYLVQGHKELYECWVVEKDSNDSLKSLIVRVDIISYSNDKSVNFEDKTKKTVC